MRKHLLFLCAVSAVFAFQSCNMDDRKTVTEFNPLSDVIFNVDKNGGLFEFRYEVVNPSPSGVVEAVLQDGVDWINDINTQSEFGVVTFNVALSEVEAREAVITLTYEQLVIELKIYQSEGEYIQPFTITVHDADYMSVMWDVDAKDETMTYLNMIVDKATWDSFPTFDEYLAYNLEQLEKNSGVFTLEDYLEYETLMTGDKTDVQVSGLMPEMEYMVYAVGLTPEQEVLTEVCTAVFTTDPIEMLDVNFVITSEPSMNSVVLNVDPDNDDIRYLIGYEEGTEYTADEIMKLCQTALTADIQEFLAYSSTVTIAQIVNWLSFQGDDSVEFPDLLPATAYTAYAVSVDSTSGILNSVPVLHNFSTLEESGDWYSTLKEDYTLDLENAVATAVCYKDYYNTGGYNWQIKIKPEDGVSGDEIDIELVVHSTSFDDGIPTGTYNVAVDNTDPMPGEFLAGEYFWGYLYTWYKGNFGEDGKPQSVAPATGGTIDVTNHGNGNYTVKFSLEDDRTVPRIFSGSWTGNMELSER